ncbi:ADIPOR-like receptor IZH1-like isoform 1 [Hibiscus syriacus]|uniref:ADIPOR-like receptor IZH1-like isoform 1 n=1 Tax=Hibiscus syriacus TaxID=106335 RepID=A0A6A2ZUV2_HIBSY|nr:ADIPOR-like receptor IZH1-like isoform 1 [Hibiscus syriacus]
MAASGAGLPMRSEVLQLYRSRLRVGRQFSDYNVREYSKRRTMDAFETTRT